MSNNKKFTLESNGNQISGRIVIQNLSNYPSVGLVLNDETECRLELSPNGDVRVLIYRNDSDEAEVVAIL